MRSGDTLARASRYVDHQAGLVAIFGGRGAGDDFQRLDGINRKLVGKHLALLIGNGLAVHGKRIFRVVAEAVKQAI